MTTEESRKFIERFPPLKDTLVKILEKHNIDYDNDEVFNWELRRVIQPCPENYHGSITHTKLFIDNQFVVNIIPLAKEAIELYGVENPMDRLVDDMMNDEVVRKQLSDFIVKEDLPDLITEHHPLPKSELPQSNPSPDSKPSSGQ